MSGPITGIDVSSWSHENGAAIDFEEVYKAGHRFVIVKATQGVDYTNPWLDRDLDDARAVGLLAGAYHYFAPNVEATLQATHFAGALGAQVLDLGAWLDWECYAPTTYTYNAQAEAFLAELDKVRPDAGIYMDQAWLEALKGSSLLERRLWIAADEAPEGYAPLILQATKPYLVKGVVGEVDVDTIANTRGLDIPTAPPKRPSAATAVPVTELVDKASDPVKAPETPAEVGY